MLTKVLFVILFSYGAAVLEECAWGESYWCKNIKTASDCGAFDHCLAAVWSKSIVTTNSNDVCQFCENVVKDARDYISDKKTQQEVIDYLDTMCAVVPVASLSQQCKDIISNYTKCVFRLLESRLDPATVCSVLGLCNGFEDKVSHASVLKGDGDIKSIPDVKQDVNADLCQECKDMVSGLSKALSNKTVQDQLFAFLKNTLCANMGDKAQECTDLVNQHGSEMIQLVISELNPDSLCSSIGACSQQRLLTSVNMRAFLRFSTSTDAKLCTLCKIVLSEMQALVSNADFQQAVITILKNGICAQLGDMKDVCMAEVDAMAPDLFSFINSKLDPNSTCAELKMCPAAPVAIASTPLRAADAVKANMFSPITQSEECILCEFIIKELEQYIQSNSSQQEIINALNKVCDLFPDTIRAECSDFVNKYAKAIIALLEAKVSPELVCQTLGLCSTKSAPKSNMKSSELCGICQTVLQYVDSLLLHNETLDKIEQILDKVCNFLSGEHKIQCVNFINNYGPMIIQLLIEMVDPQEVCTVIKLCDGQTGKDVLDMPMEKLVVAQKIQLVGTNECTYGPAFWCENRDNAERCGAVAHCQKHVWKN